MLHEKASDKKLYIVSADVSQAFDGLFRERMWKVFIKDIGNYAFLHTYKRVLDELQLDIELPFTTVRNVRSKSGSPQGLRMSAF
jgi:hypothetical protein